jgi:prepilin-type processing-associated H-X9-DG protein
VSLPGINGARQSQPSGFTVAELLVCIGLIGLLMALGLPALQRVREQSRLLACKDRLRQFGIAAHTHESVHRAFPYTATTSGMSGPGAPRWYRSVSPHQDLMYSLDSAAASVLDREDDTVDFVNPSSPTISTSATNRELQAAVIPVLLCPSDSTKSGATSYRANLGISPGIFVDNGSPYREATARRGAFVNAMAVRPDEFSDGLSSTAMFSERVLGDGDPDAYDPWRDRFAVPVALYTAEQVVSACQSYSTATPTTVDSFGGHNWMLGGWRQTWYDHIANPNSPIPDCATGPGFMVGGGGGMMSARSFHTGGVNVCFADGAVRMIASSVGLDVWRALGTRNGAESVSVE